MLNKKQQLSNLKSSFKYYILYIIVVLVITPIFIYFLSFFINSCILKNAVSLDIMFESVILDDISLILGNLLIIAIFIRKKYIEIDSLKKMSIKITQDKSLLLGVIILEISSILPINLFVKFLNLNDFNIVTSNSILSVTGVIGMCLFAPLAEELVMRGGVEEKLLQWKSNSVYAILLSSSLFAILHFYPSLIIVSFLNGIIYGWVYYKYRNVIY